tara:strand:- start:384 stop:1745 length:1362 start_codon:yes stop_codon:yes gene_type:complete
MKIELHEVKEKLDNVGCGFCLAKWTQVTMHLGTGLTQSCHHVRAHPILLDELKENPGALHNTGFKKEIRRKMLNGERPAECDYCWRVEDNTKQYSDRIYKSADNFSWEDFDTIKDSDWDTNFYPRYVEVSFSNVCNFKCSYCGPAFSSKWSEEIKKHGPYDLKTWSYNKISTTEIPILEREENPYINAFWEWFPEAVKHMKVFRITGGEPLLSKHTQKVIQWLINNPQPHLDFAINTNGCPPNNLWKKFTQSIKELEENGSIKEFTLFTSAESTGAAAEYSRTGMDWDQFKDNIEYFARNTKSKITFMCAFNIYSLSTFKDFLVWTLHLKLTYTKFPKHFRRIHIDIPYVRNPSFLDVKVATKQLIKDYLKPALKFMQQNTGPTAFREVETAKLTRIYEDVLLRLDNKDYTKEQAEAQNMLYKFILQYDRRRDTKFLEAFPEYKEFIETIKYA